MEIFFMALQHFFWYSNINNSNLYDASWHQRKIAQMCTCTAQSTLHRQLNCSSVRFSLHTRRVDDRHIVCLLITPFWQDKIRTWTETKATMIEVVGGRAASKQRAEARASEREAACRQQLSMTCVIVPRLFFLLFFFRHWGGRKKPRMAAGRTDPAL